MLGLILELKVTENSYDPIELLDLETHFNNNVLPTLAFLSGVVFTGSGPIKL